MKKLLALGALCAAVGSASAEALILGVSEGSSGGLDHSQIVRKYQGLADVIERTLQQKVDVVPVREFGALEEGMKSGRFDFVFARPSDYAARGLRDHGYKFVSSTKPDGQCLLIVTKESPIKSLADIPGKKIVLPEQTSYMSRLCQAELRDKGLGGGPAVQHVREQDAVGFWLQNKFADVGGVASYSGIGKAWEKDGHRIVHRSTPQPYFPLIAGKRIGAAQVQSLQKSLVDMPNQERDRAVLERLGIQGFDVTSEKRLRGLLDWLGR